MARYRLFLCLLVFQTLVATRSFGQNNVLSIPIAANDIVFDSLRNLIYATVKTEDSYNLGNRVVAINPATGKITKNIFVGSQPTRMALTDGGAYLYVSLGGSPRIIRIQLDRFEVDMDFLTTDYKQSEFFYPHDDIAVFPKKTDYVISTLSASIDLTAQGFGVSVLQNGKQIEVTSGSGSNPFLVDLGNTIINMIGLRAGVWISSLAVDSNIVVASEGYSAIVMVRTPNNIMMPVSFYRGVSPMYLQGATDVRIAMDNRIIYTSAGKIVRLNANYLLEEITTLPNLTNRNRPFSFFIDKPTNGIYYADTEGSDIKIKKFNKTTYALESEWIKSAVLPNNTMLPLRFIKLNGTQAALMVRGTDRLDMGQYRLIIFNLNNTTNPLVNLEKQGQLATERTANIVTVPIAAEAIVFDSIRQLYYVAVKSDDPLHGNSILALNALTFAIEKKITFANPIFSPLVLSKNSKYLYFQQILTREIRQLDLDTWMVNHAYYLGLNPQQGRYYRLMDGANINDPTTPLALLIGDDYYSDLAPKICLFDTSLTLIRAYPRDKHAIESSTDGKTIFGLNTNTTAASIKPFYVNNQSLTASTKDYEKVMAGTQEYKLLKNKIYNSAKFATRVTDTTCFIDGFYPYYDKDVYFKRVTPTDKSIFLTQLKVGEGNLLIRNIDARTLTLKEFIHANKPPNANFSESGIIASVYDSTRATLAFIVAQTTTEFPNFYKRTALFFVRDFFTSNKEKQHTSTTFSVSPNPFSNTLTVNIDQVPMPNAQIVIRDITGGIVDIINVSNRDNIVYQSDKLKSGFYFMTLTHNSQPIKTVKIVKI